MKKKNVPTEITITAYKLDLVDNRNESFDLYDIVSKAEIQFPINRIEWIFIDVHNRSKPLETD